MNTTRIVDIFTDGACSGNPGPGGWAALLRWNGHEKIISGHERETTNNRMELMAAIESLQCLNNPSQIKLHTDSRYLCDGMTKWLSGWKKNNWKTRDKKSVKNMDLWEKLDSLSDIHKISWHWIRGHDGHDENERVDGLAREALLQNFVDP